MSAGFLLGQLPLACGCTPFPFCVSSRGLSECTSLVSLSSYKDASPVGLGPHPHDLFNLDHSCKALSANMATLEGDGFHVGIPGGHSSPGPASPDPLCLRTCSCSVSGTLSTQIGAPTARPSPAPTPPAWGWPAADFHSKQDQWTRDRDLLNLRHLFFIFIVTYSYNIFIFSLYLYLHFIYYTSVFYAYYNCVLIGAAETDLFWEKRVAIGLLLYKHLQECVFRSKWFF